MRHYGVCALLACFVLVLTTACAGCGGGGAVATPNQQAPETASPGQSFDQALPAPSKVSAAYSDYGGCSGDAYLPGQFLNVSVGTGNAAAFDPECDQLQPSADGLAWAIYSLSGVQTHGYIRLTLSGLNGTFQCYAGISDFSRDTWDWHALPGSRILTNLPSANQLGGGDEMLIAIVATGMGEGTLEQITLSQDTSESGTNLFFLHHSTGQGIISGGVRSYIADYNSTHATSFEFWDHCYTWESMPAWPGGLVEPDGTATGYTYGGPCDNTDPDGLYYIWCSSEAEAVATRNNILDNHEVIAFKSCFPASDIWDAAELQQRKDWYLAMRNVFDAHPDHVFVVMSTPPLHRLATDSGNASRARDFANWLKSGTYLNGHPNVVCFDLFDALANADDSSATANMLRYAYEGDHSDSDSHPNAAGNAAVAPLFAQALIDASEGYCWP